RCTVRAMIRHWAVVLGTACIISGCSGCSSSGSNSDGGSGGGSCKAVAICTVIAMSKVNSSTGKMTTNANPMTDNTSGVASDECTYISSASPGDNVDLLRTCADDTTVASTRWDSDHTGYLKPMGTRVDLPGVGDKAYYQTEPSGTNLTVQIEAYKGKVWVRASATTVTAATEATVKQALTDFTTTLLQ